MASDEAAREVLRQYAAIPQPASWIRLGAGGGFSGAFLWRIVAGDTRFCLRCWPPEHPSPQRLEAIHAVLLRAANAGLAFVPAPLTARNGWTFVESRGRLWELTPWLHGVADYHHQPSPRRLAAAMQALARFHVAVAEAKSLVGVPPAIVERRQMLAWLMDRGREEIEAALSESTWTEFFVRRAAEECFPPLTVPSPPLFRCEGGDEGTIESAARVRAREVLDAFQRHARSIQAMVEQHATGQVPIGPCIRDIWHDHVLFSGDEVTGIVDFGALRSDGVAFDIARLLGSLVEDAWADWRAGLAAYEQIRPLTTHERSLVPLADMTTVLLSGMNWLKWICLERREFANPSAVLSRLDSIVRRLPALATRGLDP